MTFTFLMLMGLKTRQNLLLKRVIGLKKFTHITPLNEALKIESVGQIYFKHKIQNQDKFNTRKF
ncbi:hypothetical protein BpHYR1_049968 [Brachionus plicatilis]|uniref:Uncharacterized protein n=1 Tax=Brachionus plicatilis TaxID=10195 RepID=A0A3M7R4X1_BRAPC|nr:hypothetical protein BpHYR1_049968 [Brachionus plicatilis]